MSEELEKQIKLLSDKVDRLCHRIDMMVADEVVKKRTTLPNFDIYTANGSWYAYYLRANRDTVPARIEKLKSGMDAASCLQVDRYFSLFSILPQIGAQNVPYTYSPAMDLFTDEEIFIILNLDKILAYLGEYYNCYDMSDIPISINNMYFDGGMQLVPYRITERLNDTIALDCGAWVGDSSISLRKYGFKQIHCFEPFQENYDILCANISRNSLDGQLIPQLLAVDENVGTVNFSSDGHSTGMRIDENGDIQIKTVDIDSFCCNLKDRVSVIKMDIEGREVPALRGAEKTIVKHKPVLLLSVYHTWIDPEQIFTAKEYIESLGLGYEFQFKWLQPESSMLTEHTLICYVHE